MKVDGVHRGLSTTLLRRCVDVKDKEISALGWSFAYFFCLLCSYYILRPVRDEMGIQGGVENLQWLFTGTFVAMLVAVPLFGAIAARFPRRKLLPLVYYFFAANILVFYLLLRNEIAVAATARAFFVWISVFNLFVVSVFWSLMADLFANEQARRLFGFIAAGGSAGALLGPFLTTVLAMSIGPANLLVISALFLLLAVICIQRLLRGTEHGGGRAAPAAMATDAPMGGGIFNGVKLVMRSPYLLGICLFILLYTTLATFLYFEQAHIVRDAFDDPGRRTAVFAAIDLAVNLLTILLQIFVTARLVSRFGLPVTLALIPGLMIAGFISLAMAPVLVVLVAFQVTRRTGNYGIARPAREMLFTVVSREEKYKAKNFIDTVVYRGGDAVSGWAFAGLSGLGLGLSAMALIAVPIAAAWLVTGLLLGRKQEWLRRQPEYP